MRNFRPAEEGGKRRKGSKVVDADQMGPLRPSSAGTGYGNNE